MVLHYAMLSVMLGDDHDDHTEAALWLAVIFPVLWIVVVICVVIGVIGVRVCR